VAEVGEATARWWRLYMAGSRLGFERNVVQLHQCLGVKLGTEGQAGHAVAARLGAAGPGVRGWLAALAAPADRVSGGWVGGSCGRLRPR